MTDAVSILNGVSPAWFLIAAGLLAWASPRSELRKALMMRLQLVFKLQLDMRMCIS